MKKFIATIAYYDRYAGNNYEEVVVYARNEEAARRKASRIGNNHAYKRCPDCFLVESVCRAS